MSKRLVLFLSVAFVSGVFALSGCGGGSGSTSDFNNVSTGQNGSLADVQVGPPAGSTYISKATTFQVSWPDAYPPPSEFGIALRRYKEARGGESKAVETQKIDVNRQGNSFAWNVARKDKFDLDGEGVYYLEISSPGSSNGRAAYIADANRSRFTPAPVPNKSRYIPTGGNGSLSGIQIFPAPGSVNIPRNQTFRISWSGNQQPPAQLGLDIVRYKEPRGDQPLDVATQAQTIKDNGNFTYDLKRRDNFLLDSEGVYYLEITAPGETTYRAAYIVDSN